MAEQVSYEEFRKQFVWKQGEHITAVAHTGAGKTELINDLLSERDYVAALATKRTDSTMENLRKKHKFKVSKDEHTVSQVSEHGRKPPQHWILRPKSFPADVDRLRYQHHQFFRVILGEIWSYGNWCVDADEIRYLSRFLGLDRILELIWLQGRSEGISLVGATQRPKMIPLEAYSQATHLFFWRENDMSNLKRIQEIDSGSLDKKALMQELTQLPKHDFVYVNTDTGLRLHSNLRK